LASFDNLDPVAKLRFRAILEEHFIANWSFYDRLDRQALDLVDLDPASLSEEFEQVGVIEWWNARKGIFPKKFIQ
jgi:hypothetical protein